MFVTLCVFSLLLLSLMEHAEIEIASIVVIRRLSGLIRSRIMRYRVRSEYDSLLFVRKLNVHMFARKSRSCYEDNLCQCPANDVVAD